jgi:hypothetical protein
MTDWLPSSNLTLRSLLFGVTSSDPVTYGWSVYVADGGCGSSRIHSGVARLSDGSNGCAAVELNTTNFERFQRRTISRVVNTEV